MAQYGTGTFKRSSVSKMLIAEVSRTTHALPKGDEQYEAQTYLSPTGRTIAKIMIAGVATEKEDIGKDESLWRVRVVDPSGAIGVMAGKYQPDAAQVIAQLDIPCYIAIVGKLNIYEPEPGSHIVSIRPDSVTVINGANRDDSILDAALSTIRSIKRTASDSEPMKRATEIYGEKDGKDAYMLMAQQAIESLLPDFSKRDIEKEKAHQKAILKGSKERIAEKPEQDDQDKFMETYHEKSHNDKVGEEKGKEKPSIPTGDKNQPKKKEPKEKPAEPPKAKEKPAGTKPSPSSYPGKEKEKERTNTKHEKVGSIENSIKTIQEVVLEVLREKREVVYTDIPDLLRNKGINPNMMDWESAVKRLMNEGLCYEPKLGRMKATAVKDVKQ